MAKILKSDFAEFDEIVTGLNKVVSGLESVDKAASGAIKTLKGANGIGGLSKGQEEVNTLRVQSIKQIEELKKVEAQLVLVQNDHNKKLQEQKILLKQQNDEVKRSIAGTAEEVRVKKLNAIVNKEVAGSYNALDAQYQLNIISLNKLTKEQIENSVSGKKLAADTKVLQSQLQAMDMSTARNRTGFNGLRFSMIQVGRELPSIAYGFNVFAAAISNNLPMVTDEIKKARMELAALRAEGKKGVPIWKQMAGAIFSWQTALIVALSALTLYGKEIGNFLSKLFSVEKQLKATKIAQDSLNKAMVDYRKNASDEITTLKFLYEASQNDKLSREERLSAIEQMKELYPDHLKNISDEAFLVGGAADQYKILATSILEAAKASAIFDEVKSNEKKILEFEDKLLKSIEDQEKATIKLANAKTNLDEVMRTNSDVSAIMMAQDAYTSAGIALSKYQNQQEKALNNIAELARANDELISKIKPSDLEEPEKDKKGRDDSLRIARLKNEVELNNYIIQLTADREKRMLAIKADASLTEKEREDKIKTRIAVDEDSIFDKKIKLETRLFNLVKNNSAEYYEIRKNISDFEKEKLQEASDELIDSYDRNEEITKEYYDNQKKQFKAFQDNIRKKMKDQSEDEMASMAEQIDIAQLAAITKAGDEFIAAQGNADKQRAIKEKLQSDLIKIELDGWKMLKNIDDDNVVLTIDDREKLLDKIRDLEKQYGLKILDDQSKLNDDRLAEMQKYIDASTQLLNEGFNFHNQLYDNQLARAQRMYEIETAMATDSVEQKMIADAKYEKERRKREKQKAILDKAQGAFNIIINTASGVTKYLAEQNYAMATLMGLVGAFQLGTVLSKQIPAYKTGTQNSEGVALMAEEGKELVEEPSGKKWIANKKGIYDLEPHSIVYPHDETQRMLAQMAVEQTNNIVGLGETNALLRSINNNSKRSDTFWENGNFTYRKKGNIIYKSHASRRV